MAGWAFGIEMVVPLPVKPFGPVQLIVNGPVPPLTVTVKLPVAPMQIGAGGAMLQVGLGLTTRVAVQLVMQPTLSVTLAV
jgi:hypothetical protein